MKNVLVIGQILSKVITFYETSDKFKVYFDNVAAPQFDFKKRLNRMSNYVNGVDQYHS